LFAVVSYPVFDGVTAVVSPRFGAAPVSSDRLWHAAKVAAAARIQSVFISSLLVATESCPRGLVADVRQLRALHPMTDQAEAITYPRKWVLTRSWITYFRPSAHFRRIPSDPKSRQIPEQLQGGRIGQRIHVLDGPPVDHVPHRQLGDLPADRAGDVRYLQDFAR
jgi:hypothetical protein